MIARRHNELVKSAVSRPPRNQKCHKCFILVENYPAHEKLPPPAVKFMLTAGALVA